MRSLAVMVRFSDFAVSVRPLMSMRNPSFTWISPLRSPSAKTVHVPLALITSTLRKVRSRRMPMRSTRSWASRPTARKREITSVVRRIQGPKVPGCLAAFRP